MTCEPALPTSTHCYFTYELEGTLCCVLSIGGLVDTQVLLLDVLDDEFGGESRAPNVVFLVTLGDEEGLAILEPLDFAALLADLHLEDEFVDLLSIVGDLTGLVLQTLREVQGQG